MACKATGTLRLFFTGFANPLNEYEETVHEDHPSERSYRLHRPRRSTIYKYISEGSFPKRVPLGDRAVGWVESEVMSWVMGRIEARDACESLTEV